MSRGVKKAAATLWALLCLHGLPTVTYAQTQILNVAQHCPAPHTVPPLAGGAGKAPVVTVRNRSIHDVTIYEVRKNGVYFGDRHLKPGAETKYTHGKFGRQHIAVTPNGLCLDGLIQTNPGSPTEYQINSWNGAPQVQLPQVIRTSQTGTCPNIGPRNMSPTALRAYQPKLMFYNDGKTDIWLHVYEDDGSRLIVDYLAPGTSSYWGGSSKRPGLRVIAKDQNGVCIGGTMTLKHEAETHYRLTAPAQKAPQNPSTGTTSTTQSTNTTTLQSLCQQNPTAPACLRVSSYCKANPKNGFCLRSNGQFPGPKPVKPIIINPCLTSNPPPTCKKKPIAPPIAQPQTQATVQAWWPIVCPSLTSLRVAHPVNHPHPRTARFVNLTGRVITVVQVHEWGRAGAVLKLNPGAIFAQQIGNLKREPQQFLFVDWQGRCIGGVQKLRDVGTTHFEIK